MQGLWSTSDYKPCPNVFALLSLPLLPTHGDQRRPFFFRHSNLEHPVGVLGGSGRLRKLTLSPNIRRLLGRVTSIIRITVKNLLEADQTTLGKSTANTLASGTNGLFGCNRRGGIARYFKLKPQP